MAGPAGKWRDKGIEVTAWKNESGISFTIRKSYKPKDSEEWKESKSFFVSDIEKLLGLLPSALVFAKQNEPEKEVARELVGEPVTQNEASTFNDDDIPF